MDQFSMCRLCMAEDVRLLNIVNTHLQEMYESLLLIPLENEDGKPLTACFICCTRLENCYQLRKRGLRSEELFPQIMNTRIVRANRVTSEVKNTLGITGVVHLNLGDVPRQSTGPLAELNTLAVLEEFGVQIGEEKEERPFYKRSIQLLEDVEALEYIINIVKQELSDDEINDLILQTLVG